MVATTSTVPLGESGIELALFALLMRLRLKKRFHGQVTLEASGGITFDTVRAFAETGVDLIAIGALTHSAVAVDIAAEVADG